MRTEVFSCDVCKEQIPQLYDMLPLKYYSETMRVGDGQEFSQRAAAIIHGEHHYCRKCFWKLVKEIANKIVGDTHNE